MTISGPNSASSDVVRVDRPRMWLGRHPSADVRLAHPAISRRHAELLSSGGRLTVADLGSRAGVLVNGAPINGPFQLADGDQVAFGPLAYIVHGPTLRRAAGTAGVRLVADGLSFERGGVVVLSDARLAVPPNTFAGILGPSGSGKTTLLKGLTGLLPARAGRLLYDGAPVGGPSDAARSTIGFVPQEDVLLYDLTARENLDYALRLRVTGDLRADERAAWVENTLRRLSLDEHADKPVRELSGGQRKRVSVGVELLNQPRLLFLDEPSSGLDPANEFRLMTSLKGLAQRGTTVICTTHVLSSMELFDFVVVVASGRVLGGGPPANLLKHFGVSNYPDLYEKLEREPGPAPALATAPAPPPRPNAAAEPAPFPGESLSRLRTLVRRDAALVLRDRWLLALLIGQPLLISALIVLSQCNPMDLNPFFTFAAIGCIWLGLNNTAREIVRHRALYVRERRATLAPAPYLLAKVVVYAGIGLVQVSVMVLFLRYGNLLPAHGQPAIKLATFSPWIWGLALWLTYASAMCLGLLVSTLASTEEVAVAVLPLVVLPQLLLGGAASGLVNRADSHFAPLASFAADHQRWSASEWALELGSLLMCSRPSLALFLDHDHPDAPGAGLADWAHLLFLLFLTATALAAVFAWCERNWLRKA